MWIGIIKAKIALDRVIDVGNILLKVFLIAGMEGENRKQSKLKSTEKIMQKFLKG